MASGTIALTRTGSGYLTGQILWSSQSNGSAANTSTVTAKLQIQRSALNSTTGTFTGSFKVGSTSKTISWYGTLPTYEWVTIETVTVTVSHNTDGKGSCYLQALVNGPTQTTMEGTYVSGSATVTMDVIPRFAGMVSATDFTDEGNLTITYSNPAGNAVELLQACISLTGSNADVPYRDIPKTGTKYTFSLTESERNTLRAASPNSGTLTVYVYIRSQIGGSTQTDGVACRMSIVNANPVVSFAVLDTNSATTALTGSSSILVALYSKAKVTINATAKKYATIKTKKVTHGAASLSGDSTLSVTNNPIIITVTDSRGNQTVQTATNTIVPYIDPTCTIGNNIPETDGSFALEVTGLFYNGRIGATTNTLEVQYRYKVRGGSYSDWFAFENIDKGTVGYAARANLTGLDYQTAYVFQARAIDKINTNGVASAEKVVISEPVFDWGQNDFNFNVPVNFSKGATPTFLTSADDLNTIKASGWYTWLTSDLPRNTPSGPSTTYMSCMRVWQNGDTCLQECVDSTDSGIKGCKVQRVIYGSTVYDWEWVNPHMLAGVEYRTTERWNGKPVYTKIVDFLSLPASGSKDVIHTANGIIENVVSWYGAFADVQALPNSSLDVLVTTTTIRITVERDLSAFSAQIAIKYTKR